MTAPPPTEDDLHALLDGTLDPAQQEAVEAHLRANAADAERFQRWDDQKKALHRLYDGVLDEAIPERLSLFTLRHNRRRAAWTLVARAAAVAAVVVLSAGAGWMARGMAYSHSHADVATATPMVSDALSAHALFVVESRHPVEVAGNERAHLIGWLSKRLQTDLKVPDLQETGFALMGGRLLPSTAGPAAQFMYENKAGQRVTLYLRHDSGPSETAFQVAHQQAMQAFYWREDTLAYALVADLPRDQLMALADSVYKQLVP